MRSETCSCGATIKVSRVYPSHEDALIDDWRDKHRHETPEQPEEGPQGTTSHLEQSSEPWSIPGGASIAQPQARIGFTA